MLTCRHAMIINNQFIAIKGTMRFFNALNISARSQIPDFLAGKEPLCGSTNNEHLTAFFNCILIHNSIITVTHWTCTILSMQLI